MTLVRPSAGQQIASAHIDQLVDLLTAGTNGPISPAALPGATLTAQGATHLGYYNGLDMGLAPDGGVADQTAALNAALATIWGAGGGTLIVAPGTYKYLGQIVNPSNGGTGNRSLRVTGAGTTRSASGGGPVGGTIFDMRYAGTDAKLLTLMYGCLELDHISFIDGGVDTLPFIKTTRTTLLVHDCEFQGTGSGASSVQDAIILGGTGNTITTDGTGQFAGYGTVIRENFFNKVQRAVLLQTYANSPVIAFNTIWSGGGGRAAIEAAPVLTGDNNAGGCIIGNLIELPGYTYGIAVTNTQGLYIAGNGMHDFGVGVTTACYRFEADASSNLVIPGAFSAAHPLVSDANGNNTVLSPSTAVGTVFNAPVDVRGPSGGLGRALLIETNNGSNKGIEVKVPAAVAANIAAVPILVTDQNGNMVVKIARDIAGRLHASIISSGTGDPNGSQPLYVSGYGALNLNSDTGATINLGNGSSSSAAAAVNGQLSHKGAAPAFTSKAVNYTLTAFDSTIGLTASSLTVTLPAASAVLVGRVYTLKNTVGVTGTIIAPNGTDTIEGATGNNTTALAGALAVARLVCNGTNAWFLI